VPALKAASKDFKLANVSEFTTTTTSSIAERCVSKAFRCSRRTGGAQNTNEECNLFQKAARLLGMSYVEQLRHQDVGPRKEAPALVRALHGHGVKAASVVGYASSRRTHRVILA